MHKYWKTRWGTCVHRSASGIEVHQNYFFRWLTFGNTDIQTLLHKKQPSKPGLCYILPFTIAARLAPGDTCMLGLGGAGVAHALQPFIKKSTLVAVENNPEIIELARTYFQINTLKNLQVLHCDAGEYVQTCHQKYQHLMVDLFNSHAFPKHCNNLAFFKQCRELLHPGGFFAINVADTADHRSFLHLLQNEFKGCTVCFPIRKTTNLVILAYHGESISPLLELLQQPSSGVKKITWTSDWGCVAELK